MLVVFAVGPRCAGGSRQPPSRYSAHSTQKLPSRVEITSPHLAFGRANFVGSAFLGFFAARVSLAFDLVVLVRFYMLDQLVLELQVALGSV